MNSMRDLVDCRIEDVVLKRAKFHFIVLTSKLILAEAALVISFRKLTILVCFYHNIILVFD